MHGLKYKLWDDMDRVNHLWPDIARLLRTTVWSFIHCTYLDAWLHASGMTASALPASFEVWKPILPKHLSLLRCFLGHDPVLCGKEGYTPMELLQWSAECGKVHALLFLKEWGLTTDHVRGRDNSALQWASAGGHVDVLQLLKDWPGRELDPNVPHGLPPRPGSRLNLWDVRAANNAALSWATSHERVAVLQFFKDWRDAYPVASPVVCYVENGRWFSRGGKASGEVLGAAGDTRLTAHDVKCAIRSVSGGPQSSSVCFLWAWLEELQREESKS